ANIKFFPNQPPAIDEYNALLIDKGKLAHLKVPDPTISERLHNRGQVVGLMKNQLADRKIEEGCVGGPCAEAADLRGINSLMLHYYDDPHFVRGLFEIV